MWLFKGGDQRSYVDGNNWDDDAGQEDGRQFVDILDTHKDQQGHQEEADAAIDPHVVQHGSTFAFKNGCIRYNVQLEERRDGSHKIEIIITITAYLNKRKVK